MRYPFARMIFAVLASAVFLVWLMQASIGKYWQEVHHREPVALAWQEQAWWQLGGSLQAMWMQTLARWGGKLAAFDDKVVASVNQIWIVPPAPAATPSASVIVADVPAIAEEAAVPLPEAPAAAPGPAAVAPRSSAVAPSAAPAAVASAPLPVPGPIPQGPSSSVVLKPGDLVFFVGDSMMQGVAPHMRQALRKKHAIKSIDLSRQSTGLAYTGYFDWPETVRATFEKNPDIRLMLVFLGPNDPWGIPGQKGKPHLPFKSDAWDATYRSRVRALLHTAQSHQAQVLWVEVPAMKKDSLNQAMVHLNTLYASELDQPHARFVTINHLLGSGNSVFSTHAQIGDKRARVRADDGVHFTVAGQRLIANALLEQIEVQTDD